MWALMGAHFLNISIDTADPNPESIPEDLTINDQESIIELIVEKVLGFENAIEEYDDYDAEDHTKKVAKIDLITPGLEKQSNAIPITFIKKKEYPFHKLHLKDAFLHLDTPPPKT